MFGVKLAVPEPVHHEKDDAEDEFSNYSFH